MSGTRSKRASDVVGERRESRQGLQTFEVHVAASSGRVVIRHQRGICCKDGSTDPKSAACGSPRSAGKHDRAGQSQLHQRGLAGVIRLRFVAEAGPMLPPQLHFVSPSQSQQQGSSGATPLVSPFRDLDHNSPRSGLRAADKLRSRAGSFRHKLRPKSKPRIRNE